VSAIPETTVDSSVVVKWCFPEPSRPEALRLLDAYRNDRIKLMVLVLFMAEITKVLAKRVRRRLASASMAMEIYRLLKINSPLLVNERTVMDEAMILALGRGQAIYDCVYLALSVLHL
jgi:predicted nucleic acid-binding protein